eukprot:1139940-Pelagomonas_calceolata.AAC.1
MHNKHGSELFSRKVSNGRQATEATIAKARQLQQVCMAKKRAHVCKERARTSTAASKQIIRGILLHKSYALNDLGQEESKPGRHLLTSHNFRLVVKNV